MISAMINMFGVRILWMFIAQRIYPNILSVFLAYPVSWICQAIMMLAYYYRGKWLPREKWVKPEPTEESHV